MIVRRSSTRRPAGPAGFTLTELLVVIGLIVLLVTLAIPAFSIITGGRSIDSAQNQISAILGRARADAVGLQQERGVFFYQEAAGGRVTAAIVRARPDASRENFPVSLDLLPEREHLTLPNGVGVQTILNASLSGMNRTSDGYLGHNNTVQGWPTSTGFYNKPPTSFNNTSVRYGGVIMFDANGRLETKPYLFLVAEMKPVETSPGSGVFVLKQRWSEMGKLLLGVDDNSPQQPSTAPQFISSSKAGSGTLQSSQVGFILFDEPTFAAQGLTDADPAVDSSLTAYANGGPEYLEEGWIDGNGVPFLVNRYNGTLMRGE
jgi:prepilin-type N-terminal cleavage/methylation domain-containing protein